MTIPKLSVIIPCFNVDSYVPFCINSVLSQSLEDIELICIDDGSTDSTYFKLLELSCRDNRIRLFKQQNCGVAETRNKGIKFANGEYLAFMDPDDFYPNEHCLAHLYNAIKEKQTNAVAGGLILYDHQQQLFHPHYAYDSFYRFQSNSLVYFDDFQFDYGFQRFLFKREFILENDLFFPELCCFEDPVFLVKALSLCGKFAVVNDVTYAYRHNHKSPVSSIGDSKTEKRIEDLIMGVSNVLEIANERNYIKLRDLVLTQLRDSIFRILQSPPSPPQISYENEYKKKYEEILNSNSWKVTAPLRKIASIYRRIKNINNYLFKE